MKFRSEVDASLIVSNGAGTNMDFIRKSLVALGHSGSTFLQFRRKEIRHRMHDFGE